MAFTAFHGTPISGKSDVAVTALSGAFSFISFLRRDDLKRSEKHAAGFSVDNGAFSAWKAGKPVKNWDLYYRWVESLTSYEKFIWAVIPDVIDGDERANDQLIEQWPADLRHLGVPVWHMHESLKRLEMLCASWPRVAIGSSGEFRAPCSWQWWQRIHAAMHAICDSNGLPPCQLHGLRMLNTKITSQIPLTSADSTSLAINVSYDSKSNIKCRHERALYLRKRIESLTVTDRWIRPTHDDLFWG